MKPTTIAIAALALLLARPAAADFVTDFTSLPATKSNFKPCGSIPVTQCWQASDYNTVAAALYSLRTAIVAGEAFGFTPAASDPLPDGASHYLWLDTSYRLHLKANSVDALVGRNVVHNGIAATTVITDGIYLHNDTASTSLIAQYSPPFCERGHAWSTASGGSDKTVDWCQQVLTSPGNPANHALVFYSSLNGASLAPSLLLLPDEADIGTFAAATAYICQTQSGCTLGKPSNEAKRVYLKGAVAATTSAWTPTGFGTAAVIGSASGDDNGGLVSITATNAGRTTNAQLVYTFTDGAWSAGVDCMVAAKGTNSISSAIDWTTSTTQLTITYISLPTDTLVYTFGYKCHGR